MLDLTRVRIIMWHGGKGRLDANELAWDRARCSEGMVDWQHPEKGYKHKNSALVSSRVEWLARPGVECPLTFK